MPWDRYRALPLRRFTALRALELNADALALNEGRSQRFDARPLAELRALTQLALQQFEGVDNLARLPAGLEVVSLLVFGMPDLEWPRHLTALRDLTLSAAELGVDLPALCAAVGGALRLEAPTIVLRAPAGAPAAGAPPLAAAEPEAAAGAGQGAAAQGDGGGGHVAGPPGPAPRPPPSVPLAVAAAFQPSCPSGGGGGGGPPSELHLLSSRVECEGGGPSVDMLELAQELQLHCFDAFGCFCNPDDARERGGGEHVCTCMYVRVLWSCGGVA